MNVRQGFAAAVAVSAVVVACTTGNSSGTGGAPADAQGFIGQFCDLFAPCCAKVDKPTDGVACRAFYGAVVGPSQYDAAKGGDCLAELRAKQTAPDFCEGVGSSAPSCRSVFKKGGGGTKAPGEACSEDGDCASSAEGEVSCASSRDSNGAETKACQVEVDGKVGDSPCVATRDGNTTYGSSTFTTGDAGPTKPPARGYVCDLASGTYCNSTTKACATVENVGGDCASSSGDVACVKSAYCDFSTRKCVARLPVGADCSKSSSSCVKEASCDRTTKKCVALLAAGAPCTAADQCASNRCVNGKCEGSSSGDVSTQFLCGG